jgi:hypothetical protein
VNRTEIAEGEKEGGTSCKWAKVENFRPKLCKQQVAFGFFLSLLLQTTEERLVKGKGRSM